MKLSKMSTDVAIKRQTKAHQHEIGQYWYKHVSILNSLRLGI